jgi:hypothetical protein
MKWGQRVTLHGPDPAAVAKEWRDLAKQYQSAFEPENGEVTVEDVDTCVGGASIQLFQLLYKIIRLFC